MNREIKFRGKRIDNGEWVYGTYHYSNDNNNHYILSRECFIEIDSRQTLHSKEVSNVVQESVGQSTGLKDELGNEIYENIY